MNKLLTLTEEDRKLSDVGTEKAILACIMKEPSKMIEASVKIRPDDFFEDETRYLFSIMLGIFNKKSGKDCHYDITTLRSTAKDYGKEEDFLRKTGKEYIEYLTIVKESMVDLASFEPYIERVASLSLKRRLLRASENFRNNILESNDSPEELLVKERIEIDTLFSSSTNNGNQLVKLGDSALKFIEDSMTEKKKILGIRTMLPGLDRTIEGLRRKNLVIVSAAKKTGKSVFLMNIGLNVGVRQKLPTLMISTEMSDEEMLSRALANLSMVKEKDIQKGNLGEAEAKRVFSAERTFKQGNFYHVFLPGFTIEKIIGFIRKFVNNIVGFKEDGRPNDCLVIFDYIKMPQAGLSGSKEVKEYKELGEITNNLKILAGTLDIPILAACQTNRGGEVANSFEITWYCNTFMILENKSKKELEKNEMNKIYAGNQRLRITDNRGGEENHEGIDLDFDRPILTYQEMDVKGLTGGYTS